MSRSDFRLIKNVSIDRIQLDIRNARIRAGNDQADCVNRILRKEDQLITLARNIAQHGLTTMPILVSPDTTRGRFVVRDGNRRVTALKLLNDPARWSPDARLKNRFQSIANEYPENISNKVDVLCSEKESAIIDEILARHSGAAGGAGQLDWEAFMRTIFLVSHDLPAEYKRPGQYALWGEENGVEVPDEFPISSLQRFFSKDNLKLLGFDIDRSDNLIPNMREDVVKRMAATVLGDFASSRVRVSDVFEPTQAVDYINRIRAMHGVSNSSVSQVSQTAAPESNQALSQETTIPTPSDSPPQSATGSPAPASTPAPASPRAAPSPRTAPHDRKRIFGSGSPNIGVPSTEVKASSIVTELRKLDMTDTPLAAALLLRALIELSSEYYRKGNNLLPENKLARSVKRCTEHMLQRGMLDQSEVDITMRLCDTTGSLIQIESLQKMVHRDTHNLDKQFVNTFWDNIAPFVRACWR
jgi:hypothetical protein